MNKTKNILSMAAVFTVATILGFSITKWVTQSSSGTDKYAEMQTDTKAIDLDDTTKTVNPVPVNINTQETAQAPIDLSPAKVEPKETKQDAPKTDKPEPTPSKVSISKEDFQSKLQNLKNRELDPGKGIVARNLSVKTINMSSEELHSPTDIESIRNKIRFDAWQGVSVVSISYDKNGLVNAIVVQPIYK